MKFFLYACEVDSSGEVDLLSAVIEPPRITYYLMQMILFVDSGKLSVTVKSSGGNKCDALTTIILTALRSFGPDINVAS